MQAYDETGRIYFSATDIALKEMVPIGSISLNGKEEIITLAEYKEITKNFNRYRKSAMLKKVRPHVSKEDLANMTFDLQEIQLMESFDKDGAGQ